MNAVIAGVSLAGMHGFDLRDCSNDHLPSVVVAGSQRLPTLCVGLVGRAADKRIEAFGQSSFVELLHGATLYDFEPWLHAGQVSIVVACGIARWHPSQAAFRRCCQGDRWCVALRVEHLDFCCSTCWVAASSFVSRWISNGTMPVIIHLDARSSNVALRLSGIAEQPDRLLGLHWRFGSGLDDDLVVDYGKDGGSGLARPGV